MKVEELSKRCSRLSNDGVMSQALFSRSQLYRWRKAKQLERKQRARKLLPEPTVENAARVVAMFPHLGGRKGQAYMLYHEFGYMGTKSYDRLRQHVRCLLGREVARRELLPGREFYEHVRPEKPGEIWAEDFTDLVVECRTFKLAIVVDTYHGLFLGAEVRVRATAALVSRPIDQALERNGGRGPEKFLLSDNGAQYISREHGTLLTSAEIVQKRIPACTPQYNGCAENEIRGVKGTFYNVWERRAREGADKGKGLLARVRAAVAETVVLMNEAIPRPALGGVTPADVHNGRKEVRRAEIRAYREREESRQDVPPWKRAYWEILESGVSAEEMSDSEVLTKLAFFCRKPLRTIAKRNREGVG